MSLQELAAPEPQGAGARGSPGLLLSQIRTQAFPKAAGQNAVDVAVHLLQQSSAKSSETMTGHGLIVSPGLVRLRARPFSESRPTDEVQYSTTRRGGGERAAVTEFSNASRRNLIATLGTPDLSGVEGSPVFITLTYPRDWRAVCPNGRVAKQQLDLFRRRWIRRFGSFQGVWKLEFQPRRTRPELEKLAPHFHILCVIPSLDFRSDPLQALALSSVREWVSQSWYEIVGSSNRAHLAAGTQVKEASGDDVGRIVGYFAGYTAGRRKDEQHIAPSEWPGLGRYWGVNGIPRIKEWTDVTPRQFFALRRILGELMARRSGTHRRPFRNEYDGLWLATTIAPELTTRLARWLASNPFSEAPCATPSRAHSESCEANGLANEQGVTMKLIPIDTSSITTVHFGTVEPDARDGIQKNRDGVPLWKIPVVVLNAESPRPEGEYVQVPNPTEPKIEQGSEIRFRKLRAFPWAMNSGNHGISFRADGFEIVKVKAA
jgi:hypothetical protein